MLEIALNEAELTRRRQAANERRRWLHFQTDRQKPKINWDNAADLLRTAQLNERIGDLCNTLTVAEVKAHLDVRNATDVYLLTDEHHVGGPPRGCV